MGSRHLDPVDSTSFRNYERKMEAIKKKMQAMKVEKDNACDRVDVCEEACKAAKIRAQKGEDEVEELMNKSRQLETELDLTVERFGIVSLQLEEMEKAATASDDSERAKKVFQSKADDGEKRIIALEKDLKEAREEAGAADTTYDEVAKKLAQCESDL